MELLVLLSMRLECLIKATLYLLIINPRKKHQKLFKPIYIVEIHDLMKLNESSLFYIFLLERSYWI